MIKKVVSVPLAFFCDLLLAPPATAITTQPCSPVSAHIPQTNPFLELADANIMAEDMLSEIFVSFVLGRTTIEVIDCLVLARSNRSTQTN